MSMGRCVPATQVNIDYYVNKLQFFHRELCDIFPLSDFTFTNAKQNDLILLLEIFEVIFLKDTSIFNCVSLNYKYNWFQMLQYNVDWKKTSYYQITLIFDSEKNLSEFKQKNKNNQIRD